MTHATSATTGVDADAGIDAGKSSADGEARTRFISDLQSLAGHAQELLQVTTSLSGEGVAAAREQLRHSLENAGQSIKRLQSEAMDRGRQAIRRTDSYVHENPWQAIAVGLAAGVMLGIAGTSMARSIGARG